MNPDRPASDLQLPKNEPVDGHGWRRRTFLGRIAFLAGAFIFLSPLELIAAETAPKNLIPKRHRAILHFIKRYSRRHRVVPSRQGRSKSRTLRVLVRIDSTNRLSSALATMPFAPVLAGGNTLTFTHRGRPIVIENLPPRDFSARVTQVQSPTASADEKFRPVLRLAAAANGHSTS